MIELFHTMIKNEHLKYIMGRWFMLCVIYWLMTSNFSCTISVVTSVLRMRYSDTTNQRNIKRLVTFPDIENVFRHRQESLTFWA